jgi:subtilisin family serine protease
MINLDPSRSLSKLSPARNLSEKKSVRPLETASLPSESAQLSALPARIASVAPSAVAQVAKSMEGAEFKPGELIVKLQPGTEAGLMGDFASEYGATVVEHFDVPESVFKSFGGELVRLQLPQGIELAEAIAAMQQDPRVVYAEGNEVIRLPETIDHDEVAPANDGPKPPDDLDSKLWGLNNTGQNGGTPGADIKALDAWKVTTGDKSPNGPLIAVIDTGIDFNHPDLQANMWVNSGEIAGDGIDNDGNGVVDDVYGYNAFANNGTPMDGHSHGTHCAGTIGAVGNNGMGVTGVMQNARLMAVKIFSDGGSTSTDAIVRGLMYSAKMGADITSNSWGGGGRSQAIFDAFASNPALHVIAAGNSSYDNDKRDNFPSNYELDHIVAVASTTRFDQKSGFSQWGAKNVDVAAPGSEIWSTTPGGRYGNKSGTSMATPHVSGVAGLIASAYPEATNAEIKERLIKGSDPVPALNGLTVSNGRVNAAKSLEPGLVPPPPPPANP